MSPNRALVSLTAAALLALGLSAAPARAQLVPRLVDYPAAPPAAACTPIATDSPYAQRSSGTSLRLYGDRHCDEKALLYTVEGSKLTITPLGAAMVATLCDARLPGFDAACAGQKIAR